MKKKKSGEHIPSILIDLSFIVTLILYLVS